MRRIVVVGTSCSGKSTLARQIADTLNIKHIELDALHWLPGWQECPLPRFEDQIRAEMADDAWVADGNYSKVRDLIWSQAETIIWLNYAFPIVMSRALRRTFKRVVTREALYNGNRENVRQTIFSRDSILLWVVRTFGKNRRRYTDLMAQQAYPHLNWIELRRPADARKLIAQLTSENH